MSLRERLEAKQIRRRVVPILVSDPSQDQEILHGALAALAAAQRDNREDETKHLLAKVQEATEAVRSHWVPVELCALPKADWNAAASEYQTDEGIDWDRALPELLAASCTDTEGQDAEWWAKQLARPEWSEGDIGALRLALLHLNVEAAADYPPKG